MIYISDKPNTTIEGIKSNLEFEYIKLAEPDQYLCDMLTNMINEQGLSSDQYQLEINVIL